MSVAATTTRHKVEVDQRALVDKILARYATDFGALRELVQNADDAGATEVEVTLELSSAGGSGGGPHPSAVRVWNNGRAFTDADWQRVRKIAAGNPDEATPYFTCWQTGLHNDHHPHREKKQPLTQGVDNK